MGLYKIIRVLGSLLKGANAYELRKIWGEERPPHSLRSSNSLIMARQTFPFVVQIGVDWMNYRVGGGIESWVGFHSLIAFPLWVIFTLFLDANKPGGSSRNWGEEVIPQKYIGFIFPMGLLSHIWIRSNVLAIETSNYVHFLIGCVVLLSTTILVMKGETKYNSIQ